MLRSKFERIALQRFQNTHIKVSAIYWPPDTLDAKNHEDEPYELAVFGIKHHSVSKVEDEGPDVHIEHHETREEVMIAYEYWCIRLRGFAKPLYQILNGDEATNAPSAN